MHLSIEYSNSLLEQWMFRGIFEIFKKNFQPQFNFCSSYLTLHINIKNEYSSGRVEKF